MSDYRELSDCDLAFLLKDGDHVAYTEIYERYFGLLYVHGRKKIRDNEEARDVVQETFVSLWKNKIHLKPELGIKAYLYTSLRNKIIDFYAHQDVNSRYINSFKDYPQASYCITDHRIRESQLAAIIENEIKALPPRMREIFELSRKEHLTHREVAERLDLSEHTVKTQVKHALRILRVRLGFLVYLYLITRF
ncbi:RNA polymerase sigma factor [Mucilaginibacter ximonensis]|uniref:RNA polymerase sigma factor n=1 Tax=Mucilaginibacter ximonensis TaxID=538021 RepID=A0ABW5YG28_9SPHI